ncbi:MAG TPA: crosslink repair DNA glycosylase YcaQ family protein [Pseudonocardiaceae bacterium]
MRVTRAEVLAQRVVAQGLDRAPGGLDRVLALGLQDTGGRSARLAAVARSADGADVLRDAVTDEAAERDVTLAWTTRGAPHAHRTADLPALIGAHWPLSDADALSRVGWQRQRVLAVGMGALTALSEVAHAMRGVVTGVTPKGEASAAVTAAVPDPLSAWCEPCGVRHVFESLFRLAALPAGLRLEPGRTPAHLAPIAGRPSVPERPEGTAELVRAYLRVLGPAGRGDVAAFLGTTQTELRRAWPDDLVEVDVDGRTTWITADRVDALEEAPPPRLVRLLPPSDPWLQARDRELLLDRPLHRRLWTALHQPGAVLVDGELLGTWRATGSGRSLRVTVNTWAGLTAANRDAVAEEAGHVAAVRGAEKSEVVFE